MSNLTTIRAYQENYLRIYKQSYKRYIHNEVKFTHKLNGILGARGVGKSTFLLQYFEELEIPYSKKLYLSADAIDVTDSLFEIAYTFSREGGELLIIDEIHKYKEFEKELKKIYDMLELKVIFSGSSALKLDNSKGDLSRRAILHSMKGLSFREFIEMKKGITLPSYTLDEIFDSHIDIAHTLLKQIKPYEFFKEYLEYGFYPFYFEDKDTYLVKLQETVNAVIEVDIPSIFPIEYHNIINLKKLVKLICSSQPFKINIKELSTKVGIKDYQTLYRYLEYLSKAKIINLIRPLTRGDNIFTKPEKMYLSNTNLHFSYCDNQEIGTLREVFIMSMLVDNYKLEVPKQGDFLIDEKYLVEVGGKSKTYKQIKGIDNSYVIADDIEIGSGNKIPLWLFGFLY